MIRLHKVAKAIRILSTELNRKDLPAYWVSSLLIVADAGDKGITTTELAAEVDMNQPSMSRMLKVLSKYRGESGKLEGEDLYTTTPDHENRHRYRIFLTERGKEISGRMVAELK